jgi:hypothetical protein
MLPLQALHRCVSEAAKANANALGVNLDAPSQLCAPADCTSSTQGYAAARVPRRRAVSVSFADTAELVSYIPEEKPEPPDCKRLRLKSEDGRVDDTLTSVDCDLEATTPKSSLSLPGIACTPRSSQSRGNFFSDEEGAASTSNLVLPIQRGTCEEERDGDATPRNSARVSLGFALGGRCFDAEEEEENRDVIASNPVTPKARSSTSKASMSSEEKQTAKLALPRASFEVESHSSATVEEAVTTPKASLVLPIPIERGAYTCLDGDATPRHNPSVNLDFCFGAGASDEEDDGQESIASDPGFDFRKAEVEARTPKAGPSTLDFFNPLSERADSILSNESKSSTSTTETVSTCAPGDESPILGSMASNESKSKNKSKAVEERQSSSALLLPIPC